MSQKSMLSALVGSRIFVEKLVALVDQREPEKLASEALATLIADFGATAGSLFFVGRPRLRIRQGTFAPALAAHLDQWEDAVEQRIMSGAWRLSPHEISTLAARPIPGTGQSALYSPILDGQDVIGSIYLAFPQHLTPRGEQRKSLATYLQAVGALLCLLSEHAFIKERLAQLSLFYQMAQSMASTFDLNKILGDAMQLTTAILDATASVLMLVDEESGELVFEYAYGDMGNILRKQRTPINEGIAGWVVSKGAPLIVNDVSQDPRFDSRVDKRTGFLTRSVICVPIQLRGKTIGILEALNKRGGAGFDSEDLRLMVTTANQAAVAIGNARLYQNLRDERDRILQAQENVRRQVARNLHDGTVQFLSAISMGINHLERLLDLKPEAARSELESLRDLTRQATRQARLALFELRPLILETQGLVPALEAYVEQLEGNEEFGIHLETVPPLPQLEASVAASAFAIVQEAVNNAKKHASARDVWIRLSAPEGVLQVVIEDNGVGFDLKAVEKEYDQRGSFGLLSMRERAELVDGQLQIESRTSPPNSGTKVILRIPDASLESEPLPKV